MDRVVGCFRWRTARARMFVSSISFSCVFLPCCSTDGWARVFVDAGVDVRTEAFHGGRQAICDAFGWDKRAEDFFCAEAEGGARAVV